MELHDALLKAVTTIAYAWAQVIAGDIVDLTDGLEHELW
jgi:hypothetical protein